MLTLVVVDRSAESRHRLVGVLQRLLGSDLPDLAYVPRVSIVPRAPHEMKFHAAPDICIIGREIVEGVMGEIAELRRTMPDAVLLAELWCAAPGIGVIEQLARYGIDDILAPTFGANDLIQKLILLIRKRGAGKRGQLIVVGAGKGGLGVTSVSTAVAEIAALSGKNTVLVDFDVETQDASRFLHTRPYLNETLQAIFDQLKPLTYESVEQCLVPLEGDAKTFRVMPPMAEREGLFDPRASYSRILVSLLEMLDEMFDVTVVDIGAARGAVLDVFHRTADVAVLVTSGDPAALYPSLERARRIRASLGGTARLVVVENRTGPGGLPTRFAQREVARAGGLSERGVPALAIPYCARAAMWPGSGETLYRLGRTGVRRAFERLGREIMIEGGAMTEERDEVSSLLRRSLRKVGAIFERTGGRKDMDRAPQQLLPPPIGISSCDEDSSPTEAVVSGKLLDPRALISGFRQQRDGVS